MQRLSGIGCQAGMRRYAGFLILFISLDSVAQPAQQGKFGITLNLPDALDFISFPAIEAGLEYKPGGRFAWFGEFGIEYLPWSVGWPDTLVVRPNGIKAKAELRYFTKGAHYLAFNAFFARDAHNTGIYYYPGGDTLTERINDFGVRRVDWGWNLLVGKEKWLFGRLWVDMYAGLGMRFGDSVFTGEEGREARAERGAERDAGVESGVSVVKDM